MQPVRRPPFIGLLLACAMAGGCAKQVIKLYSGADLPGNSIVLIENNPRITEITDTGAVLKSVDGKEMAVNSHAVEVLPGEHVLEVYCSLWVERLLIGRNVDRFTLMGDIVKQIDVTLTVDTKAGHAYRLSATEQANETCAITLVDITSGETKNPS